MSGDGLFHIDRDGDLVAMTVTPYEAEAILQALLETHPDLLAGGQMTPEAPRRWALVRREQGVPDRDDSASRWSVDHLFVDQDAVPTLVEVKRSTDTRIRREVVGQMLDYAANGVRYWPVADLRAAYEKTQQELERDPLDALIALCSDDETTMDDFFARVGDNLRAGRIRMVFVADVIPDELMRITEFLNEQMNPAEVYAVEVKQYRAKGYPGLVIVPAVYGRTATASAKKSPRRADRAANLERSALSTLTLMHRLVEFAAEVGLVVQETPTSSLFKTPGGGTVVNLYLADWDSVDFYLKPMRAQGWDEQADAVLQQLRSMTSKRLTTISPNLSTADALAHWDDLKPLLMDIAVLYMRSE